MSTTSHAPAPTVGPLLRTWRTTRGMSQMALALAAGVSTRHLSFIETGRATPSREMVLALAEALDVPLRERNALLAAAGFAPAFGETPLDAPAMAEVRAALEHLLAAAGDNPALVVNRRYDILSTNAAAQALIAYFAPGYRGRANVVELVLADDGLRPALVNWGEVGAYIALHTRDELSASRVRDRDDEAILRRVIAAEPALRAASPRSGRTGAILVPLHLRRDPLELHLFTTITTLGTPLDVTLQELRVETLFAADEPSRRALRAVVASLPRA